MKQDEQAQWTTDVTPGANWSHGPVRRHHVSIDRGCGESRGASRPGAPAWYCIRSQQKHEHIAAANLRQFEGVDVFNPRLRVRRATPKGSIWQHEPLFPNYLFARFALEPLLDPVRYTAGVNYVVHFGHRWPAIPDPAIEELRLSFEGGESLDQVPEFAPGDEVNIVEGPFLGFTAVVQRYLPAAQRIRVLLHVLGQATPVELSAGQVTGPRRYPSVLLDTEATS